MRAVEPRCNGPRRPCVQYVEGTGEEGKEQVPKSSRQDKNEGAVDKVKGRVKEATGSLTGNKDKKAEGRADQDKGTLKDKKGAVKDLLK
jgi:uncharacterized protein YjbJ (UPF0337 family)